MYFRLLHVLSMYLKLFTDILQSKAMRIHRTMINLTSPRRFSDFYQRNNFGIPLQQTVFILFLFLYDSKDKNTVTAIDKSNVICFFISST